MTVPLIERFPEINFNNYIEADVRALQDWAFEAYDELAKQAELIATMRKVAANLEREKIELMAEQAKQAEREDIDIVFDGPPSHEAGRFVEVENMAGASIKVGEWIDRGDGFWALRINVADPKQAEYIAGLQQTIRSMQSNYSVEACHRQLDEIDEHAERVKALEKFSGYVHGADGELSAIAHGRPPSDKTELLRLSGGLRELAAVLRDSTPRKTDPGNVYCDRCDGCGWYEGGKTIRTECEVCGGTGVLREGKE